MKALISVFGLAFSLLFALACGSAAPAGTPSAASPATIGPTRATGPAATTTNTPGPTLAMAPGPSPTKGPGAQANPTGVPVPAPSASPAPTPTIIPATRPAPSAATRVPPATSTPAPKATVVLKRGDRPGERGSTHSMAFDGNLNTFFDSSYPLWQFIDFEFDATVGLTGFRRYMTRDGSDVTGARDPEERERISYSVNGFNWIDLRDNNTLGWEDYVSDRPNTWLSVNYGWSPWLRVPKPIEARFVRFQWNDAEDAVNEIELAWVFPPSVVPTPAPPTAVAPTPVTAVQAVVQGGDHPGEGRTAHAMAYDGDLTTYFDSSYSAWQFIEFKFNTAVGLSGLRRYMTRDGSDTIGNRGPEGGERISFSMDGIQWMDLRDDKSAGWTDYLSDRPQIWHSLDYGWSPWLRLNKPVVARYVRFEWDDAADAVNEIDLDWVFPPP